MFLLFFGRSDTRGFFLISRNNNIRDILLRKITQNLYPIETCPRLVYGGSAEYIIVNDIISGEMLLNLRLK